MKTLISNEMALLSQDRIIKCVTLQMRDGVVVENTAFLPGNRTLLFEELSEFDKNIVFTEARDAFSCLNSDATRIMTVTNEDTIMLFDLLNTLKFDKATLQIFTGTLVTGSEQSANYDMHMVLVDNAGVNYILGYFTHPVIENQMPVCQAFLWKSDNKSEFAVYSSPEVLCNLLNIIG